MTDSGPGTSRNVFGLYPASGDAVLADRISAGKSHFASPVTVPSTICGVKPLDQHRGKPATPLDLIAILRGS